ncbi:MAG TPA: FGGY family carbohydrate kinase [Solirubrobacteraceae bacterium]|jgi:xylulokinase|nr:FGGY family carbohydrate kinase [Solirubrobacteraceae bacterium]
MEELLLGIDLGSSSSKAVLAQPDGTIVDAAEREHQLSLPRPGWAEHDAEQVWWGDLQALLAELGRNSLAAVRAVCVSGIGPCLLPIDRAGDPLRPAILYGIDTRASAEVVELTERYGADAVLASGGSPLTSQAVGPKLLWLRRHESEVWERTRRFVMASSFAVLRLTGEYVLDHHSASQCNPLYDLAAARWRDDWSQEIAPGLALPRLLWPGDLAGSVTAAAAAETGLRAGTSVAAGTIDAWAESLSAGADAAGDTMLAYGTTMFIVHVAPTATPHPSLWLTAGVTPGSRTIAAGMATSGALTGWLREIAGGPPFEQLVGEAAATAPGADGLVVLPYFAGERTPLFDPSARGAALGLTLNHHRGHLYRALLEATAFGTRHNLEAIQLAGGDPARLVAVGGGTRGGLWTQIVSDVTGRPQDVPGLTIGASFGDAQLAGAAAGLAELDSRWNPVAETIAPQDDRRALYDELYAVYRELYPATRDLAHRLSAHQLGSAPAEPAERARPEPAVMSRGAPVR